MARLDLLPKDVQDHVIKSLEGKPSYNGMALMVRFTEHLTGDPEDPMNRPSDMDLINHACTKLNEDGDKVFDKGLFELFQHVYSKGFTQGAWGDNSKIITTISFKGAKLNADAN